MGGGKMPALIPALVPAPMYLSDSVVRSVFRHFFCWLLISFAGLAGMLPAAAQSPSAPAHGVLWEIRSATNTAYLFGSVHLARADFYPLPESVQQAYRQADTLAVELDSDDAQAVAKAMPLLTYAAPDRLQNHLQKATWAQLQRFTGDATTGLQRLKPAVVATGLMMQVFASQGYDPQQGVDLHFIRRARADRKPVIELESMEFQSRILGGLSDADGDALLAQTLDSLSSGDAVQETAEMVEAWKRGDNEKLVQILQQTAAKDAGSQKMMKLLLDDRNPALAAQISTLMQAGKKLLIVVGAGHIAGQHSITELLQQQGMQVRQIR